MTKTPDTATINLHVGDFYMTVEPVVPNEVTKALTYWHKEMAYDPKKYCHAVSGRTKRMYNLEAGGTRLSTLPGYYARIRAILEGCGYLVRVVDERTFKPEPDLKAAAEGLLDYQLEGMVTWAGSRGGILSCFTGYGKTHLIAGLFRAWPRKALAKVGAPYSVLVTPGADLAKKNWEDLKRILPDRQVGMVGGGASLLTEDIIVATPESLHHIPMDEAGVVIYDEVHTFTANRAEKLLQATKALRFGCSATPTGRFDNADLLTEGVFGPIVYTRSYQQGVLDGAVVPLKVYWVPLPKPDGWPDAGFKRKDAAYARALWTNADMHRAIATVSGVTPADKQLLVVVDKIGHMNNLMPYLEGFTMVHAETSAASLEERGFTNVQAVSDKNRTKIYSKIRDNETHRIISTGIYRQGVSFSDLIVLVNAEGMGSTIIAGQLPGRTSRLGSEDGQPKAKGYIVDFFHPWDMVADGTGRQRRGFILSDDVSREKVYTSLGFEQEWVTDAKDVKIE